MKKIIIINIVYLVLAISLISASATPINTLNPVLVKVYKINQRDVNLYIVACDKNSFESSKYEPNCHSTQTFKIKDTSEHTFILNLPQGDFAIFGYVDENNNAKLDTNFLGIPKEDVFYSVSVTPFFFKGSPKFDKIKSNIKKTDNIISLMVQ